MSHYTDCANCGKEWMTPGYRRKPSDAPYVCPDCRRADLEREAVPSRIGKEA